MPLRNSSNTAYFCESEHTDHSCQSDRFYEPINTPFRFFYYWRSYIGVLFAVFWGVLCRGYAKFNEWTKTTNYVLFTSWGYDLLQIHSSISAPNTPEKHPTPTNRQYNHNKNNIMLGFLFFNLNERGERSEEALSAAAVNIRFGLSCRT